jgi:putative DNA primase/helicase
MWYEHRVRRYVEVSEPSMKVAITGFVKTYFDDKRLRDKRGEVLQVRRSLVAEVLNALAAMVAVDSEVEMPAWLGDPPDGELLAVSNGLLAINSGASWLSLSPPDARWFSPVSLPVPYEPSATCQRWLQFLDDVMEGDAERIQLVQEFFGYLLTPDCSQHKFILAEGEGANGKSVFLDVLTALLGPENVSHVPLEMFGGRFQLTATVGKLANICAEIGEIDRVAEGFLKQFTAGDRMYFDRKNLPAINAYPTARLVLSTNNRPRFRDRSAGLWRRMIVLPFNVTIPVERQDPLLRERLKGELPGILRWALEGRRRFLSRGRFEIPGTCAALLSDYKRDSNPASAFLEDTCEPKGDGTVLCGVLYQAYSAWCRTNGHTDVLDAKQFGKEVKKAFPTLERVRVTAGKGRPWAYRGLTHVPSSPMDSQPTDSTVEE